MKRTIGTISLLMLLTIEVLTPISYAVDGEQDSFVESISEVSTEGEGDNTGENGENVGINYFLTSDDEGNDVEIDEDGNIEEGSDGIETTVDSGENNFIKKVIEKISEIVGDLEDAVDDGTRNSLNIIGEDLDKNIVKTGTNNTVLEQNGFFIREEGENDSTPSLFSGEKSEVLEQSFTGENGELTGEIEKSEIDIAWETLNEIPITGTNKSNRVIVNVEAQEGIFPKGTELRITPITKTRELNQIREQIIDVDNTIEDNAEVVAFNISFIYTLLSGDEVELQPLSGNTVKVSFNYEGNRNLIKADTNNEQEVKVFHIDNKDENGEKLEEGEEVIEKVKINEEASEKLGEVVVDAESFSTYAVTVGGNSYDIEWNENVGTYTIEGNGGDSMNNFSYGTLTVGGITIMDRNLGATDVWAYTDTWNTLIESEIPGTYGYYYQRGNNYGFKPGVSPTTVSYPVDNPSNPYSSSTWNTIQPWTTVTMWGGDSGTEQERQGPCPTGYHVPNRSEWVALVAALGGTSINGIGLANIDGKGLAKALKLPPAGYRKDYNLYFYDAGNNGSCWSSSPKYLDGANYAYNLYFSDGDVYPQFYTDRSYGFPVRCFKNSPVTKTYTLTFDSQGGSEVETGTTVENETWERPSPDPIKENYTFVDWYTSTGYDTVFDFATAATANTTVYAKWHYNSCPENYDYDENLGICYIKNITNTVPVYYGTDLTHQYNSKNIGTITVKLEDGNTITMMDMNLGATTSGTDSSAYGELYQRGNNAPIKNAETVDYSISGAIYENYWPGHRYSNSNFINGNKDYWSGDLHYDNLWGGTLDVGTTTSVNTFWGGINNGNTRQGPCPEGYHVPSIQEWNTLITYWYNTKNPSSTKSYTSLNSLSDDSTFRTAFLLPFAGFREYSTAVLLSQGFYGIYWSSSPYGSGFPYYARYLTLDSTDVHADNYSSRAGGFSVRCFKDSTLAPETYTLELDANGGELLGADNEGKLEQKVAAGKKAQQPVEPTKEISTFQGWVYADDETTTFDFTTQTVASNINLKVKWGAQYSITFDATQNGANSTSQTSITQDQGATVTLPACNETKSGYACVGWNTDKDAHVGLTTLTLDEDKTVYAIFSKTVTATFNTNGATSIGSGSLSCTMYNTAPSCTVTAPSITRDDWNILGWNTDANETTQSVVVGGTITLTDDTPYYAITEKEAVNLTGNVNGNNSTLSSNEQLTCTLAAVYNTNTQATGCTVTMPTVTANANTPDFVGFNVSSDSTTNNASYNTSTNKLTLTSSNTNRTWYAITKSDDKVLHITYEIGTGVTSIGKTSDSCTLTGTYNGEAQATSCTVKAPSITVSEGYKDSDKRWTESGTNLIAYVGADITLTENSHFVAGAKYKASTNPMDDLEYTIRYEDQNGKTLKTSETIANQVYGTTVTVTPSNIDGYITPASKQITIALSNPDVVFVYTPREDIQYTVTYKDINENSLLTEKIVNTGVMDSVVTETAPEIAGYTVQTGSFTITLKATNNHIDFKYTPDNNISYTVYYKSGDVTLHTAKVVNGKTMATEVIETAETIPGYTVDQNQKTLTLEATNNVIIFTYTPIEYAIKFVDESSIRPTIVRSGDFLSAVDQNYPEWTRPGYTIHWDKSIPATMPLDGLTITAKWEQNNTNSNTGGGGGGGGSSSSSNSKDKNNNQKEHNSANLTGETQTGNKLELNNDNLKTDQGLEKDEQSIDDSRDQEKSNSNVKNNKQSLVDDAARLKYSEEVINAYTWAYSKDITTMSTLEKANPEGGLIRQHMAKMVVNYAVNVLGREIPEKTPRNCKWKDGPNSFESQEMVDYALKACKLGLMGIDMDYFQPNLEVSRAQFGTILSRLLYGTKYAGGTPYYRKHLNALKSEGIMTQIKNPENRIELREWVWVMLMRVKDLGK